MHERALPGVPDFFFPRSKLAIFLDGCFWHRCPTCKRHLPKTHRRYWSNKFRGNVDRRLAVNAALRKMQINPLTIWEHELRRGSAVIKMLDRIACLLAKKRTRGA
jgi:DNA mismatch endonuclease (patch repair protein)